MAKPTLIRSSAQAHRYLIDELTKMPEVSASGFWKAMRELPEAEYFGWLIRNDPEWMALTRFTPDAFAIDTTNWVVTIFEAVVSHDIPPLKMNRITELAWALDEDAWSLSLVRCDITGCRVYDPLAAYVCEGKERVDAGLDALPKHEFWQRYTTEYCGARFAASAAGLE